MTLHLSLLKSIVVSQLEIVAGFVVKVKRREKNNTGSIWQLYVLNHTFAFYAMEITNKIFIKPELDS